jgi:pimeloyl-ACP methyl ester carboxylesterase
MGPAGAPVVILIHGSSANLGDMRLALGKRLSDRYHVILVDRPGHGWSDRPGGRDDAAPDRQAKLIAHALQKRGVRRAVLVAHSWGGAVALAYALENPQAVSGLVLLAPLAYQPPPSVAWHTNITNALLAQSARIAEAPVIGPFFSRTIVFPLGQLLLGRTVQSAFDPQQPPAGYIGKTGAELLLRPAEFIANGQDLALVDRHLQIPSLTYPKITAPTVIVAGDADGILSPDHQARKLATALPHARLDVLGGVGHMVDYADPDRVVDAVEAVLKEGAE